MVVPRMQEPGRTGSSSSKVPRCWQHPQCALCTLRSTNPHLLFPTTFSYPQQCNLQPVKPQVHAVLLPCHPVRCKDGPVPYTQLTCPVGSTPPGSPSACTRRSCGAAPHRRHGTAQPCAGQTARPGEASVRSKWLRVCRVHFAHTVCRYICALCESDKVMLGAPSACGALYIINAECPA